MNLIFRYWTWLLLGLFLILATGLLSLSKIRKGFNKVGDPETNTPDTDTLNLPTAIGNHSAARLAQVLEPLFVRTGLDPVEARNQLIHLGILQGRAQETASFVGKESRETGIPLVRRDLQEELEKAVQAGLRKARYGDNESFLDSEDEEEGEADEFEIVLTDEYVRDRLELCSKLVTHLQEMSRRKEFPQAQRHIEALIATLHGRANELIEDLTHRTLFRVSEVGTHADRQFYYFQIGVLDSLRGKGIFPELDAVVAAQNRPGTTESALNYKVQEAYAVLKQGHAIFALLERTGIEKLQQASQQEIRAMINRSLPESHS